MEETNQNRAWKKFKEWESLRARIEHEDNLLNSRANIFLVVNSLVAVAVELADDSVLQIAILFVVILIINALWIMSSMQTTKAIKVLSRKYIKFSKDPVDELVRDELKMIRKWPLRLYNTEILGIWIPLIIFAAWLIAVAVLILSW